MKKLSKDEMKKVVGGFKDPDGIQDDECSVSCDPGFYACCCPGSCLCHSESDPKDYGCTSGGKGSTSCSP